MPTSGILHIGHCIFLRPLNVPWLLYLGLFYKLVGNYLIRLFLQNLWNTNITYFTIAKKFIY